MRRMQMTLMLVVWLSCSGCMSCMTLAKAGAIQPPGYEDKPAQPAYYMLLPFAAAADIATSPFQLPWWIQACTTGVQ